MRKRPKGRKLSNEVLRVLIHLEPDKLYSLAEIVKTVYPRDHALYDVIYRRIANYLDNHFAPDLRDHPYRYYGKTLQSRLTEGEWHQARELAPKPVARRLRKYWLLAASLVLLSAAGATITRLDPLQILDKLGIGEARQILASQTAKAPSEIYQQAWIDYWEGNYQDAEARAYGLLAEEGGTTRLKAECYYLLGNIYSATGSARHALSHFEVAYRLYGEVGSIPNLYLVALEMARAMIISGDYGRARDMLAEAHAHFQEDQAGAHKLQHPGQYYMVLKVLAMREHDFKAALDFAIKRYQVLQGTDAVDEKVGALTDLGFLFTVNGCTEQGIAYTNLAKRKIFELGDERRYVFCQLNDLVINSSLGYGLDQHTLASVEEWSKMKGDSELAFHLKLALNTTPKEYADESCEDLSKSFSP